MDLPEDIRKWKNNDVITFLSRINFNKHLQQFKQHNINGKDLLALTDTEMKDELGITVIHERKKIKRLLSKLLLPLPDKTITILYFGNEAHFRIPSSTYTLRQLMEECSTYFAIQDDTPLLFKDQNENIVPLITLANDLIPSGKLEASLFLVKSNYLYAIQSPNNAKEDIMVVNSYSMDKSTLQPKAMHNATKTTVYSTLNEEEAQALLDTTKNTTNTKVESPFNKYIEEKSPTIKVGINQLITRLRAQVDHKSSRQKEIKPSNTANNTGKTPERMRNTKIKKEVDTLINQNKERIIMLKKKINSDNSWLGGGNNLTTH